MRTDILERREEILAWVEEGQSKAYMYRKLRCKPITLNSWLDKMGVDYKGNQGGKGIKSDPKRKTAKEYIKSTCISSHKLRIKLIEDGIKEERCERCKLNEWMGLAIPLELHHIDGNRFNNEFNNLQVLCPNCHSLTDNNSGNNKGKYL